MLTKHRMGRALSAAAAISTSAALVCAGAPANASAASAASGKAAAVAAVKAASGPVKFVSPGKAINISKLRGKTVWLVSADTSLPFVVAVVAGMKQAAAKAGVSLQVYNGQGSDSVEAAGVQHAISAKAGAIILFGINLSNVSAAVKAANAAHIPVIGALNEDVSAPLEKGAAGEVSISYYQSGKLLAAYAAAHTSGPVHAAYQNLPAIATFASLEAGIKAGMKQYCSSKCTLSSDDLTEANFKTAAENLTASEVARDPSLNWVFPFIDGVASFTIPAIQTAGDASKIRVGSINAVTANLQFIKQNHVQAVDVGNNNTWFGWAMIDRALRAMVGAPHGTSVVPIKLFDSANLRGVNLQNQTALYGNVNYGADYRALWTK